MAKLEGNVTRQDFAAQKGSDPIDVKIRTMLQRKAANKELIDANGNLKQVMTFTAAEQHSNVSKVFTQLDRFRKANEMAHRKCHLQKISTGATIQYEGKSLKDQVEVWELVSDGLQPLADGFNYKTAEGQFFSIKQGRVVSLNKSVKTVSPEDLKYQAQKAELDKISKEIKEKSEKLSKALGL